MAAARWGRVSAKVVRQDFRNEDLEKERRPDAGLLDLPLDAPLHATIHLAAETMK